MSRGFASMWLYPPVKQVKIPSWLAADVKEFCHQKEVERFRKEVTDLGMDIRALKVEKAPPSRSQVKRVQRAKAKRTGK